MNKQWLPVGAQQQRFVNDEARVWAGPGRQGLQLQQVGVSVPLNQLTSQDK